MARKSGRNRSTRDEELAQDEIDLHMQRRRKDMGDSEDEEEQYNDDMEFGDPVLDINGANDSSDDDDDVEDTASEDDYEDAGYDEDEGSMPTKKSRARRKHREDEDDDDDDNNDEDEDEDAEGTFGAALDKGWGKSKEAYYGGTDSESGEEDDENLELEQAEELERQQLEGLDDDDFGLEDMEEETSNRKKKSKASKAKSDDSVLNIQKDLSALDEEEVLNLIVQESPEFLGLLDELKQGIETVRTQLQPVKDRLRKEKPQIQKGLTLLDAKYHLLLMYCMDIVFYMTLKAEGKSVKNHPVISHLVEVRTALEKTRPLDDKIKYLVNRLLNADSRKIAQISASMLRPNPDALVAKDRADFEDGEIEEEATYRPPKLAAVQFEDTGKDAAKRREEQRRRLNMRSDVLRDVQEEFDEAPKEITTSTLYQGERESEDEDEREHRRRYEEENFTRITLPKKKTTAKKRNADDLQTLADFGGLGELGRDNEDEDDITTALLKKKSMKDIMRGDDSDDDVNLLPKGKKRTLEKQRRHQATFADEDEGDGDDYDSDNEYYDMIKSTKAKRKQSREDSYATKFQGHLEGSDEEAADGKREISYQMEKNKGLTPSRKKELKNPRVKHRRKFEKAKVRRKSQVKSVRGEKQRYSGEASGIRTNIARSVKFGRS
eukprot:Clim_evm1s28 gene=Clim_evmTU1s28